MIYSDKESIEDLIVRLLVNGQKTVKEMQAALESEKKVFTSQGVYKALAGLIENELVIKKAHHITLMKNGVKR